MELNNDILIGVGGFGLWVEGLLVFCGYVVLFLYLYFMEGWGLVRVCEGGFGGY